MKRLLMVVCIATMLLFSMTTSIRAETVAVKISWEHDLPSDLAGFKLYSQKGAVATCPDAAIMVADLPYVEGEPLETDYQITGNQGELVAFKITAYDTSGNESECSDEATFTIPNPAPNKPFNVTIEVIVTP